MKKVNKSRWLNRYKMLMRKKPTKAEKIFNDAMKSKGIKFRFQSFCYTDSFQCIVDFLIKSDGHCIAIEIDGGYHSGKVQKGKDQIRTLWLKENRGYDVIRFTNDAVFSDVEKCLKQLSVYYINKVKKSESNNFLAFCGILGLPDKAGNIIHLQPKQPRKRKVRNMILAQPNWGNEEPFF